MLQEIKKNLFIESVRDLFVRRMSLFGLRGGQLALNSISQNEHLYREVISWSKLSHPPESLKIVNRAFADNLNKYEAAAMVICHFLDVDTDNLSDLLSEYSTACEYSEIYSLFERKPSQLYRTLGFFRDNGDISNEIFMKLQQTFDRLFTKYPEFKDEKPEAPIIIPWWELAYNDSKNDEFHIVGRFMNVSDVVAYIVNKEGGKDLFWRNPSKYQYDDWGPTIPPTNDLDERSLMAIPRRGWETLWKEYQGIKFGANFDHWQALKKETNVRPKDRDKLVRRLVDMRKSSPTLPA